MADESQYQESGGNKRKYDDEAPRRRATGFSSPISAPRSYNSVAPPLEGIELAKHKAQEVAARLAAEAAAEDAKRARFDDGSGGYDNGRGFSSAPSGNERTLTETVPLITPVIITPVIQQLPSALEMFEDITTAPKVTGKEIVILLDYDGILSTVASRPDRAFMTEMMRSRVRSLAKLFPTAIVSNRSKDEVNDFLELPDELYLYHKKSSKDEYGEYVDLFQHDSGLLHMIDEAFKQLLVKTKSIPRAKVEKKSNFCLSVHYGSVDEKNWSELVQHVDSVLQEYPELKLTYGRKVLEIRPAIEPDKGKVLASFLKESSRIPRFVLYIGDDHSDEDAFKILLDGERGRGIGILVSQIPKHTNASYALRDQYEVMQFLHRLVDWRVNIRHKNSVQGQELRTVIDS